MTKHVLIIHKVANYRLWRKVFDQAEQMRKEAGELRYQLLAADSDNHLIVHFAEWSSVKAARTFFESDHLVQIRKTAGVEAPEFHYLNSIELKEL